MSSIVQVREISVLLSAVLYGVNKIKLYSASLLLLKTKKPLAALYSSNAVQIASNIDSFKRSISIKFSTLIQHVY